MKSAAVVLSAGTGSRMKSDIPKQYLPLLDKPVIYYSLKAFEDSQVDEVVLVCGAGDEDYCRNQIVEKYHLNKVKQIIPGGKERYDSVYEGLKRLAGFDYVLIHDGARPMLTKEIIHHTLEEVQKNKACVVGMPVKDTIKKVDEDNCAVESPERRYLWLVQTPQAFSYDLIYEAYTGLYEAWDQGQKLPPITDDAMVVEQICKHSVKLIEGSYENIKITTPEDILVAEVFLKKYQNIC